MLTKQKLISIFAAATLALSLAACGGATNQTTAADTGGAYNYEAAESYESYSVADADGAAPALTGGATGSTGLTEPADGRMVIMRASISMETLEFEATLAQLRNITAAQGGYISGSEYFSHSGYSYGTTYSSAWRSASLEIRVPTGNYTSFMEEADGVGTITHRNETSEDVTGQYTDIEGRLRSLRTQEERLLELMEQAGSLEDLLTVERNLADVQYQIESYTGNLNRLSDLVSYSTIKIDLSEVAVLTEPEPETYLSRVGATFRGTWLKALENLQDLGLWLVAALPGLLLLAILTFVAWRIYKTVKKRGPKASKTQAVPQQPFYTPPQPPVKQEPEAPKQGPKP